MSDKAIWITRVLIVAAAAAMGLAVVALVGGQSALGWIPLIAMGLVALAVLIFVHEGGHFLSAKAAGLKVHEFMFGLPGPKLLHRKIGETDYGVTAIPFGGYVKFAGSDPFEEVPPEDLDRSFTTLSMPKKIGIIVAGPVTNMAFALLMFVVAFKVGGMQVPTTRVADVVAGSPAALSGIVPGDRIVKAGGQPVGTWDGLVAVIRPRGGEKLELVVDQGWRTLTIAPTLETTRGRGFLGIGPATAPKTLSLWESIRFGSMTGLGAAGQILHNFIPVVFVRNLNQFSGPVGIVEYGAKAARSGPADYAWFVGIVSLALGLFNLLPIPPLDGGRVLILLVEGARRKPLAQKTMIAVTAAGASLLVTLMLYLVYTDLARVFS